MSTGKVTETEAFDALFAVIIALQADTIYFLSNHGMYQLCRSLDLGVSFQDGPRETTIHLERHKVLSKEELLEVLDSFEEAITPAFKSGSPPGPWTHAGIRRFMCFAATLDNDNKDEQQSVSKARVLMDYLQQHGRKDELYRTLIVAEEAFRNRSTAIFDAQVRGVFNPGQQ